MNPEAKSLWLTELRDPNQEKIRGRLRELKDGKKCHCAMGLLVLAYEKQHNVDLLKQLNFFDSVAERKVQNWAGLKCSIAIGPLIRMGDRTSDVAWFNDETIEVKGEYKDKYTLAEIADAIEVQL
jgi:hypothetical protein